MPSGSNVGAARPTLRGPPSGGCPILAADLPRPSRRAARGGEGRRRRVRSGHGRRRGASTSGPERLHGRRVTGCCAPNPMTELARVLFGREDIRRRVELGRTITGDYVGREPVLISVLKGGTVFLADLIRAIDLPLETHLMAISPYGAARSRWARPDPPRRRDRPERPGRPLVEDIVDTGHPVLPLVDPPVAQPGVAGGARSSTDPSGASCPSGLGTSGSTARTAS